MKTPSDAWRSLAGYSVRDIVSEVSGIVGGTSRVVHVGTDARHRGLHTHFVTVVALYDPGRGGRVFYQAIRDRRSRSLAHQLFREAELSIDVALRLSAELASEIVVHVDVNEDARHRSSRYAQALAGMVIGHGFRVQIKPHAWCATHVADFVVKEKHKKAA